MSLPKLSSREAEATIQKAIQDFDSGVEPSIRKASNVRSLPRSTVTHRHAGRLPRHLAHKTILHPYQEDQIVQWIHECQSWGLPMRVNMLPVIAGSFLAEGRVVGKHWGERFLQHHGLETIMSRQLDCQRAWNDDPVVISDWFKFF